jgi:ribonuclease HI
MTSRNEVLLKLQTTLQRCRLGQVKVMDCMELLSVETLSAMEKDISQCIKNKVSSLQDDSPTFYVFTDGACTNNGKPNARASFAVFFTDQHQHPLFRHNFAERLTDNPTNQRAELMAILRAFEILNTNEFQLRVLGNKNFTIASDSMYSINCLTKWYKAWEKNQWKTAQGKPVKNASIIRAALIQIRNLVQAGYQVQFKHVFSHTQEPTQRGSKEYLLWYGNNECDRMASRLLQ